ncbi:MAG: hypothetical protein FJ284_14335 [Planctomycetes bacterium]|nr:hypothetical protein [Planctomycetota bacterium]MBM4059343.1 hypothetical protein [Planctomycetota bacterium]
MDPLAVLLRWSHVLAAIAAVGGLLFARVAVLPATEDLAKDAADRLHDGIRRRWFPWVISAITLLLASGLTNYVLLIRRVKESPELWGSDWMSRTGYHTLFGVKFLLAMVVFYLASGLVGRGAGTRWIRDARRQWLSVTVGLGVAIVLISGWMRQLHTGVNELPDPVREYAKTYLHDVQAANESSGRDPDEGAAARPADRPSATPSPASTEENPDGQETEKKGGRAPAEDHEAAAAPGGGEETAG